MLIDVELEYPEFYDWSDEQWIENSIGYPFSEALVYGVFLEKGITKHMTGEDALQYYMAFALIDEDQCSYATMLFNGYKLLFLTNIDGDSLDYDNMETVYKMFNEGRLCYN